MKNLPKEFVLTDFTREEGAEVLRHHGLDTWLMNEWRYLIIQENSWDAYDEDFEEYSFPKISYKEWKEIVSQNVEDKFPEKWFIVLNSENISVVNKWRKGVAEYFVDNLDRLECTSDDDVYRVWSEDIEGDGSYYDFGNRECFDGFVEITFDQFKKFVLKEDIVETYAHTIDIIQLRELYNNANKDGKEFLEKLFKGCDVFWELFYLNNDDVDFLRGTCNKEIVNKIFGELIDFERLTVGSKIELKDGTVGRIVILKSEWFIGTVHNELFKNGEQCYTTIITEQNNFIHYYQDKLLTEIKHVIEY